MLNASRDIPGSFGRAALYFLRKTLPYFVFLRAGFTVPRTVASPRGGLLRPLFTLTGLSRGKDLGGIFSAALSVASRHLGVTQRSALGSSDFPPVSGISPGTSDCPAHSPLFKVFIYCQVCKSVCFGIQLSWDVADGYVFVF